MNYLELLKNNKNYFEDFIARSTYHSNKIEGSTLTYAETYAVIFNDNKFKINASPREIYEAINHKYALNYMLDILNQGSTNLDANYIIRMNELINKNIKDTTGYRKIQVFISGVEEIPPAANEIPEKMMYFINNYNNFPISNTNDIFYKIAQYHIEFEHIHPFEDGNGRTGRLLINYELLKHNLAPVIIPADDRTKYFGFISNYDTDGLSNYFKELHDKELERINRYVND